MKALIPALLAPAILLAGCSSISINPQYQLSPETDWVANSPEWISEAESVYAEATEFVRTQGSVRPAGSWAVIMDIDETVLNNVAYQLRLDRSGDAYSSESWYEWTQEEKATLVPGSRAFIDAVRDSGGLVALVTNRRDIEQLATETNLAKLGVYRGEDFQVLLTRAEKAGDSDKQARFELVEQMLAVQGYPDLEIVAFVGDNLGDRPANAQGSAFFCIDQGAMYGDPCAARPGSAR